MYSPHYSPYIYSGVPRNILPHPIKGSLKIPRGRGVLKESMVLKRNFWRRGQFNPHNFQRKIFHHLEGLVNDTLSN